MKQVNLRDFQLKASAYLSDLPFELISHGKVVGVMISPADSINGVITESYQNVDKVLTKDSGLVDRLLTKVQENQDLLFTVVEYVEAVKAKRLIPKASADVDKLLTNRCEFLGCKSFETTLVTREAQDAEGNLKEFKKWLCVYHQKAAK